MGSPENGPDRQPTPEKSKDTPENGQQSTCEATQLPEPADEALQPPKKKKAVYKRCKVPGCGATVKRMWNHIYGSSHKNLTG